MGIAVRPQSFVRCAPLVAFLLGMFAIGAALAQNATPPRTVGVQERSTQIGTVNQSANQPVTTKLDSSDQLLAQIWGLNMEEMQRAKVLLQGPRASFSVTNLSPVEALGIHARNDAERRKYAELFAKAVQADVERSLAWNRAFQEAMNRLYGPQQVVDFSKLPRVVAPVGAADAANVPRDLVSDPAPSARSAPSRALK